MGLGFSRSVMMLAATVAGLLGLVTGTRAAMPEAFVGTAHRYISDRLEAGGAHVDAYYYCPHHPSGIVEGLNRACDCRKPRPGLLLRAAADLDIDLEAGRAAGTGAVLVRTGYGAADERAPKPGVTADATVDNLAAAAGWILGVRS